MNGLCRFGSGQSEIPVLDIGVHLDVFERHEHLAVHLGLDRYLERHPQTLDIAPIAKIRGDGKGHATQAGHFDCRFDFHDVTRLNVERRRDRGQFPALHGHDDDFAPVDLADARDANLIVQCPPVAQVGHGMIALDSVEKIACQFLELVEGNVRKGAVDVQG